MELSSGCFVLAEATFNFSRNATIGLAVALGLYMLGLFVLSLFATKNVENEEDFLVAGRRLSLFFCFGSLIATWFGAATMNGAAQQARDEGMRGTVLDPWACSFTLIIAGLFFAKPLWRMKLFTTGDFFRRVYGTKAEIVCGAIQIPSYFGWIAGQYRALSEVQFAYFGIPKNWGIFIGFFIALVYTMVGGMWSVTLIDTVQILVAFFGLIVLFDTTFSRFGNGSLFAGVDQFLSQSNPDDLSLLPVAGTAAFLGWIGTWATGLLGNLPGQDLQQRMFSAKDEKTAARACVLSGIVYLLFGLIPISLGLLSKLEHPQEIQESVLMLIARDYLTPTMAIVFTVSFVSIVMSTACSAVLAPATILGHNFLGRLPALQKNKLRLERICVLLISLGGLALAYSGESVIGLLDLSLSIALSGLFVPLAMGLYGKPLGQLSSVLATISGTVLFFCRYLPEQIFFAAPEGFEGHYYEHVLQATGSGLLSNLAVIPADLYGLGASFAGYFVGQALEKRRGGQWNPTALHPPTASTTH